MCYQYKLPEPILDKKELAALDDLNKQFEKMTTPNKAVANVKSAAAHFGSSLPAPIKSRAVQTGGQIKNIAGNLVQAQLFNQVMNIFNESYSYLQDRLSKFTIINAQIVKHVSNKLDRMDLTTIQDFVLLRSYEISKIVGSIKVRNYSSGLVEGGATGALGFAGLPLNLALSNLLFFRVIQEVATYYGYDVKNDEAEMVIAGEVFAQSLKPTQKAANNELSENILKILTMAELQATKATAKKGWAAMIERGGIPLALAQIRALANKAAEKALVKAGGKGIEFGVFKTAFEQIGKRLSLNATGKAIPVIGAGTAALIDSYQMNKVFDYANIFYQKRFILEKKTRIQQLVDMNEYQEINTMKQK